jgi:hypothetical protein
VTRYRGQPSTHRVALGAGWGVSDLRRRPAPAVAAQGGLKAIRLWTANMGLTIGDANDGRLSFDNVSSFDASVFSTVSTGGRVYSIHCLKRGWYAMFVQFAWTGSLAAGQVAIHWVFTGDTVSGASMSAPTGVVGLHLGPYPAASITRYFPDEFDSLPGAPEIWVAQNSGSAQTINQAIWQTVYLGDSDT